MAMILNLLKKNLNCVIFIKKSQLNTVRNIKLNTTLFKSQLTPQLLKLKQIFKENNFELKIVGGAVRDLLLGKARFLSQ